MVMDPDTFRDALAHWASGVAVAAVREEQRILATTMSAFLSVSVTPPLVLLSLGPTAQVLPFMTEGRPFGISILSEEQSRAASVFADSFPVGPSPFAEQGGPVIEGSLVQLECRVRSTQSAGDHQLVFAAVESATMAAGSPLIRYDRAYRRLAD